MLSAVLAGATTLDINFVVADIDCRFLGPQSQEKPRACRGLRQEHSNIRLHKGQAFKAQFANILSQIKKPGFRNQGAAVFPTRCLQSSKINLKTKERNNGRRILKVDETGGDM